jgi:hypothetical protein
MYNKILALTNKLGIFYQLNENRDNFLKDHKVLYKGFEVKALSLYAAWCLIFAMLNGVTDPDYIIQDASEIEDVLCLRKSEQIYESAVNASYIEIELGNGYKRTVGDYLSLEEIQKYMVSFNFSDATPVSDVLKQYDANYEIIKALDEKIYNTSDYAEHNVWSSIKKANMISKNIANLFRGYVLYSECIKNSDGDFWKYLEPVLTNREPGYKITLREECIAVQETYRDYIMGISQGQIILAVDEKAIAGGENIAEIGILFNEFMSYYTQLFRQNFTVGNDDPNNTLCLLYAKVAERIFTESSEEVNLYEKIVRDKMASRGVMANIELLHYITDISKNKDFLEIVLSFEQKTNLMKCLHIDSPLLDFEKHGERRFDKDRESISLSDAVDF